MQSFLVSQIASSVWPFAVWPSTSQKVARNKYGTFYVVGVASGNLAAATPTTFTLFWERGEGPLAIWTQSLGTNMVNLVAFESGEVCLVYSNFAAGTLVTFCWPNITITTTPNTAVQINGFGYAGKTGAISDDARRCIHVMGMSGNYARLSVTGALKIQQAVIANQPHDVAEYFAMSLDEAANLYATMNLTTSATTPEYDGVTAIMSPNPSDNPPSWYAGSLAAGAVLIPPFNPSVGMGTVTITTGEQQRNFNNWLIGSTVYQGMMHTLIGQAPALSERGYEFDDFRDLTVEAAATPWTNNQSYRSAIIHRPFKGQTLFPKCVSGGIAQRASGLYGVVHDRTNLITLRSLDNGKSWQDYAVTSLLPFLGTGTDVSTWYTPRDLGIMRGNFYDTDIIGMFTVMQCSPTEWANNSFGFNPLSSTYIFSVNT